MGVERASDGGQNVEMFQGPYAWPRRRDKGTAIRSLSRTSISTLTFTLFIFMPLPSRLATRSILPSVLCSSTQLLFLCFRLVVVLFRL